MFHRLTRSPILPGATIALVVATLGCAGLQDVLNTALQKPTARVEGVRLSNISLDHADLAFDVRVTNPLSGVVPLRSVGFRLSESGNPFLEGSVPLRGEVDAGGSELVSVPVKLRFAELVRVGAALRPGNVVPYTAALSLEAGLPGGSSVQLPLETSGEFPVPAPPRVSVSSIDWSEVSPSRVAGTLSLNVGNTNRFPFRVSELSYGLNLAGADVADETARQSADVDAGGNGTLQVPLGFSPLQLGIGLVQALLGGSAPYEIGGALAVTTPFGPMSLDFDSSGRAPMSN